MNKEETNLTQMQKLKIPHEYKSRCKNRTRMRKTRESLLGVQEKHNIAEKRKLSLRKRYKDDVQYRDKKLKTAFDRYMDDDEFKANVRNVGKQRYNFDIEYKTKTRERSRRERA